MDPTYQQVIVSTIRTISARINALESKLNEIDTDVQSTQPQPSNNNTTATFDIENRLRDLENKIGSAVERKELQSLKTSLDALSTRIASLEQCAAKMATNTTPVQVPSAPTPSPFETLSNSPADDDIVLTVSQTPSTQESQPAKKRIYRKKT